MTDCLDSWNHLSRHCIFNKYIMKNIKN